MGVDAAAPSWHARGRGALRRARRLPVRRADGGREGALERDAGARRGSRRRAPTTSSWTTTPTSATCRTGAPRAGRFQSGDGALDAHGVFAARVPLALAGQHGTEVVTLEAEVEDVSRQTAAARASGLVHPASFYVALRRPKDWFVAKGDGDARGGRGGGAGRQAPRGRAGARGPRAPHVEQRPRVDRRVVGALGRRRRSTRPSAACDVASGGRHGGVRADARRSRATTWCARAPATRRRARSSRATTSTSSARAATPGGRRGTSSEVSLVPDKKSLRGGRRRARAREEPVPRGRRARHGRALGHLPAGAHAPGGRHADGAHARSPTTCGPNAFVSVHLVRGRTKAAPARGADVGRARVQVRLRAASSSTRVAAAQGGDRAGEEGAAARARWSRRTSP